MGDLSNVIPNTTLGRGPWFDQCSWFWEKARQLLK
jgi:hypothetical protein